MISISARLKEQAAKEGTRSKSICSLIIMEIDYIVNLMIISIRLILQVDYFELNVSLSNILSNEFQELRVAMHY
jgi:hypothetical protein